MALTENTKTKALNEGKSLLQLFGYNGFSFQHIADALGLRKQSLYVHFKSKEELGEDLLETYRLNFLIWKDTVSIFGPEEKVIAWFDRFYRLLSDDLKYCPLAALAADYNSLPKPMQKKLTQVFEVRRAWLLEVVKEGQQKKVFRRDMKAEALAHILLTCAFGSQAAGRLAQDPESVRDAAKNILKLVKDE